MFPFDDGIMDIGIDDVGQALNFPRDDYNM